VGGWEDPPSVLVGREMSSGLSNTKMSRQLEPRPPPTASAGRRAPVPSSFPGNGGRTHPSGPVSTSGKPWETTGSPGTSLCSGAELPLVTRAGRGSAAPKPAGVVPLLAGPTPPNTDTEDWFPALKRHGDWAGQEARPRQGLPHGSRQPTAARSERRAGKEVGSTRPPKKRASCGEGGRGGSRGRGQECGQHQEHGPACGRVGATASEAVCGRRV